MFRRGNTYLLYLHLIYKAKCKKEMYVGGLHESGLPVGGRFGLGHLVYHRSYLFPVVKVFPLVIKLQDDADDLQNLHRKHTKTEVSLCGSISSC